LYVFLLACRIDFNFFYILLYYEKTNIFLLLEAGDEAASFTLASPLSLLDATDFSAPGTSQVGFFWLEYRNILLEIYI